MPWVLLVVAVATALGLQALVLRWAARAIADEGIDWGVALGIVIVGGLVGGLANCLLGSMGAVVGGVAAFAVGCVVNGLVIHTFTRIEVVQAMLVSLTAAVVSSVVYLAVAFGVVFLILTQG